MYFLQFSQKVLFYTEYFITEICACNQHKSIVDNLESDWIDCWYIILLPMFSIYHLGSIYFVPKYLTKILECYYITYQKCYLTSTTSICLVSAFSKFCIIATYSKYKYNFFVLFPNGILIYSKIGAMSRDGFNILFQQLASIFTHKFLHVHKF